MSIPVVGRGQGLPAFRPDLSHVDFAGLGEFVICVDDESTKRTEAGIELPNAKSPWLIVCSVGSKVEAKLGYALVEGDRIVVRGCSGIEGQGGAAVKFAHVDDIMARVVDSEPEAAASS